MFSASAFLLAVMISVGTAFVPITPTQHFGVQLYTGTSDESPLSATSTTENNENDRWYSKWADDNGVSIHNKISLRAPSEEERGKGGMEATDDIRALEVLARIPRELIVSVVDAPDRAMEAAASNVSWATALTAATLVALHPTDEELTNGSSDATVEAKREWIQMWEAGGWGTDGVDLGPSDVNFGPKDVTGSLLATGSDNDHNIFAKFRMPCHPVVHRASLGLKVLTGCTEDDARDALTCRGSAYRGMKDALQGLVLTSSERLNGSKRERRCWDVADILSRVLSRATTLQLGEDDVSIAHAIVPLHDQLAHSLSENSKLVAFENEVLLVATRDIVAGEAITRDYTASPRLDRDESQGSLHLLLQFGLPPSAWPTN